MALVLTPESGTKGHSLRTESAWSRIRRSLRTVLMALTAGACMVYAYVGYVVLPEEIRLRSEIQELESNYLQLNGRLDTLTGLMSTIELQVDHIYQITLGIEPRKRIPGQDAQANASRHVGILENHLKNPMYMDELYAKVDLLKNKISNESSSQRQLLLIAKGRQKMFAAIPAIQPISNQLLTALASGYGMRMHPFYHMITMHQGIDFAAPEGTLIYATADGEVVAADTAFIGYGTMVILDHGFGYHTRYAHLKDFIVTKGDRVTRGEPIGYVGNTGQSTAPHLHYEVLLQGIQINPIHYFFNDLTPASYARIVQLASIQNQSMGN